MNAERLTIEVTGEGDATVVRMAGELDIVTADQCKRRVSDLVDGGAGTVRLDLAGLGFVDSSGLGALVAIHHHAVARGAAIELQGVPAQVRRLMEITKLDELFTIS
jgi:anti-sigma B factor antagonist